MKPGDPVEVYQIWAGGFDVTHGGWFGGYTFEYAEPGNATFIVRNLCGDLLRYAGHRVRMSTEPTAWRVRRAFEARKAIAEADAAFALFEVVL